MGRETMTPELTFLLWSTALLFVQIVISAASNVRAMGQPWGIGNREVAATSEGFPGRAKRAYMNMLENFVLFAAVVLIAQAAGIHTNLTVLGAEIFLIARVVYAIVYLAGWTFISIRTIAWLAGVIGTILVFYAVASA
jgi:uncharacterized MAPEG superfamily protein